LFVRERDAPKIPFRVKDLKTEMKVPALFRIRHSNHAELPGFLGMAV